MDLTEQGLFYFALRLSCGNVKVSLALFDPALQAGAIECIVNGAQLADLMPGADDQRKRTAERIAEFAGLLFRFPFRNLRAACGARSCVAQRRVVRDALDDFPSEPAPRIDRLLKRLNRGAAVVVG